MSGKCTCSFAQRIVGDGCRYCQPQEYIDRLHDHIKEQEAEAADERYEDATRIAEAVSRLAAILEIIKSYKGREYPELVDDIMDDIEAILKEG